MTLLIARDLTVQPITRSEAARVLSGHTGWIAKRDAMTERLRAEIAARQGRGG